MYEFDNHFENGYVLHRFVILCSLCQQLQDLLHEHGWYHHLLGVLHLQRKQTSNHFSSPCTLMNIST